MVRRRACKASTRTEVEPAEDMERLEPADGRCKADVPKVQENLRAAYDAEECRPGFVGGDVGEFIEFERQGDQAARLTSVGVPARPRPPAGSGLSQDGLDGGRDCRTANLVSRTGKSEVALAS